MNNHSIAPPNPPLRAVVFDLDGLMVNTEDIYHDVGSKLLARRGKTFDDDLRHQMMGQPAAAALQVMIQWHRLADTVKDLAVESDDVFWETVADRLETMPGLIDLLAAIESAGIRCAVATSGASHYAAELLDRVDLTARFEFVLSACDVTHGKPHPEIYELAARRLGMEPVETLALEDSQNGCRAAVAAGAYTVAVPSPHSAGHDFTGARFVANSLSDARILQALKIAVAEH